ncbi:DUF1492 domain-containing protein [Streptococcus anginosus]|uniref:DUF1492 domain-containing protein n=1 Tax=Streptococcus anginosus TaxID=1328 RepID=UPI003218E825
MNKAKELLDELQCLDEEIQNRIDELANLEASLLSSPKIKANKVSGGQQQKIDERYVDIISMHDSLKEYMKEATAEAIERRIELSKLIDKMPKPASRTILRMVYIQKANVYDMIEFLQCSKTTFYKKKKDAIRELDVVVDKSELM